MKGLGHQGCGVGFFGVLGSRWLKVQALGLRAWGFGV